MCWSYFADHQCKGISKLCRRHRQLLQRSFHLFNFIISKWELLDLLGDKLSLHVDRIVHLDWCHNLTNHCFKVITTDHIQQGFLTIKGIRVDKTLLTFDSQHSCSHQIRWSWLIYFFETCRSSVLLANFSTKMKLE